MKEQRTIEERARSPFGLGRLLILVGVFALTATLFRYGWDLSGVGSILLSVAVTLGASVLLSLLRREDDTR